MAVDYGTMTDDQIIAAYKARFGGDVSAIAGAGQEIDAAALYDNMVKWYDGFLAKNGRSPNEGEWIGAAKAYGNISTAAAKDLYDKGANYVKTTGQRATPDEWGQWLAQATREPTFDREKYEEDLRRWGLDFEERKRLSDIAQANWDKNFDESQRRYETDLLSSLSGVQDWVKYWIAQSGMPLGEGGLADVFARTPSFGAVTPDPSNSWEGRFADYWNARNKPPAPAPGNTAPPNDAQEGPPQVLTQPPPWQSPDGQDSDSVRPGRTGPTGRMEQPLPQDPADRVSIGPQPAATVPKTVGELAAELGRRQPTSIGTVELNRMTPSQRKGQSGAWSAAGLDVDDMWDRVRKAQPQGQAQRQVRWT